MDCYLIKILNYREEEEEEEEEELSGVVGEHLARAAKALVVSEPMAIFYSGDEKS